MLPVTRDHGARFGLSPSHNTRTTARAPRRITEHRTTSNERGVEPRR